MKRSETLTILPGVILLVLALVLVSARYLPVMQIDRIESASFPITPGMRKAAAAVIGDTYPHAERRKVSTALEALPYIENVALSYNHGALVISSDPVPGLVVIAKDGACFTDGENEEIIELRDAGALYGVYPVIGMESFKDIPMLSEYIPTLVSDPFKRSLITWFDFGNNNEDGSAELKAALPELNASVILKNPAAAERLEDTIGIIEESCRTNPGRTLFAPMTEYELYGDRLVRLKG